MSVFFDGRLLVTPTSASRIEDSAMYNRNLTVPNNVLLIGSAKGGLPKQRLSFGSPAEAKAALIGGELMEAAVRAFAPSAQTGGPTTVHVVRVDPALPSSLTLKSAADADVVKLESVDAGDYTKNIQARVEAGTAANTVRLSVRLGNGYCASPDLASLDELLLWVKRNANTFVKATKVGSATALPKPLVYTALAGGTNGTTTLQDWQDAFDVAQRIDAQWITPVSGTEAVHAMADTHVAFMSTVGRKERRSICGTALDTTDAAAIQKAFNLNSDRTSLVHLGFWDYDYEGDGDLKLFPPYVLAAMLSGMFAGVNPGTALTNKTIRVRGLERELRNPTDTDQLINGGVLCVEVTEQGYKVVQSITTWLVNNNYNRVEQSTGAALDQTVRNVREATDVLRGDKGNPFILQRAVSIAQSSLKECARAEPEGPGLLAGDEQNPPFKNIEASMEGDVLRIQYECSPVIPANYVLTTVYARPWSGVATAA